MKDLDHTNSFVPGSQEHLAYQWVYWLSMACVNIDYEAMCGRLLGYMLLEVPWDEGHSNVIKEINSCIGGQKLLDLATFHINFFLCL